MFLGQFSKVAEMVADLDGYSDKSFWNRACFSAFAIALSVFIESNKTLSLSPSQDI